MIPAAQKTVTEKLDKKLPVIIRKGKRNTECVAERCYLVALDSDGKPEMVAVSREMRPVLCKKVAFGYRLSTPRCIFFFEFIGWC